MEKQNNNDGNVAKVTKLKFYNTFHHSIYQWFWLIFTTIVIVFGLPWLIYLIGFVWRWNPFPSDEGIKDFLFNFFAGMIGIIVGFIFDLIFIERLRRIKKFVGLRDCLIRELKEIGKLIEGTLIEYYYTYGNMSTEGNGKKTEKNIALEINTYAFKDIITSAENEQVFYHLPRYWIFNKKGKGIFAKKLHEINTFICKINRDMQKERSADEADCQLLLKLIVEFLKAVDDNAFKKDGKILRCKREREVISNQYINEVENFKSELVCDMKKDKDYFLNKYSNLIGYFGVKFK